MNAHPNCTREGRTPRFNLPVCHRSRFRRLLDSLLAPSLRLHRYRTLSVRALESTLEKNDRRRCT